MSEFVMDSNMLRVHYAYAYEFVVKHWQKTGEWIGFGSHIDLKLDEPWKRELVTDLGWIWVGIDDFISNTAVLSQERLRNSRALFAEDSIRQSEPLTEETTWQKIRELRDWYMSLPEDERHDPYRPNFYSVMDTEVRSRIKVLPDKRVGEL